MCDFLQRKVCSGIENHLNFRTIDDVILVVVTESLSLVGHIIALYRSHLRVRPDS
jgi:hypothetical protein